MKKKEEISMNKKEEKIVADNSAKSSVDLATLCAVVDVPWVLAQMPSFIAARTEQQQNMQQLQQDVNNINAEIARALTQNEKQALSEKYKGAVAQRQSEIQRAYAQKLQDVDKEITKLISDTAKEQGYKFVFAKTTLIFGGTDITPAIAEKLKK